MIEIVSSNIYLQIIITIFFGMLSGSFSTAIIYRENSNQSWIWNNKHKDQLRSFCPTCQHTLGVMDLIPIISWLFQKGSCRYCKVKIPIDYIVLEVFLVVVCLSVWGILGGTVEGVLLMILSPFIVSQAVLFFKYKKISATLISIVIVGGVGLFFVI